MSSLSISESIVDPSAAPASFDVIRRISCFSSSSKNQFVFQRKSKITFFRPWVSIPKALVAAEAWNDLKPLHNKRKARKYWKDEPRD